MDKLFNLRQEINNFKPFNQQEENDKKLVLELLDNENDLLTRNNRRYHFTVSAWLVDQSRNYVLMAYHNIYQSWAWLGGHADGNANLKEVILKEIEEESGLSNVSFIADGIYSLEILPVAGHNKKGDYISSHLHLNVTYLLQGDKRDSVRIKEDENSNIGWIEIDKIDQYSTEQWFIERVYTKLAAKMMAIG